MAEVWGRCGRREVEVEVWGRCAGRVVEVWGRCAGWLVEVQGGWCGVEVWDGVGGGGGGGAKQLLHSNFQSWQMRSLPTLDTYVCLCTWVYLSFLRDQAVLTLTMYKANRHLLNYNSSLIIILLKECVL